MLISGIQPFTILDYPGKVACIIFTPGCNFRCSFCHNPEFVLPERVAALRSSFITEEAFFNFLEQRKKLLDGVVITGGEPTLMPDLEPFIRKIKTLGLLVKLDSNGNRPEMLARLIAEKLVDYVAMDVKTDLPHYHELAGKWVVEENIVKSIELLKQNTIPYEFRTTLIKEIHPTAVVTAMGKLVQGATNWNLQTFRPATTLDPAFQNYTPFSEEETGKLAEQCRAYATTVNIR
jgi:pyruvate formate lyase activating enzyme